MTTEEALKEILMHCRKTQKPLKELANMIESVTGDSCSASTVHRIVRRLEDNGFVKVDKPEHQTKPNTITYIGDDEAQLLVRELKKNLQSMVELVDDISNYLHRKK